MTLKDTAHKSWYSLGEANVANLVMAIAQESGLEQGRNVQQKLLTSGCLCHELQFFPRFV